MEDEAPLSDQLISPLLHLLQVLHETAAGDLEVHIILLAIAARVVAHPDAQSLSNEERLAQDARPFPTRGVNVRSIADSTGMARETVRRKVAALLRAGWIAQSAEGLTITGKGYMALNPAREEIEQLAHRFHDTVAQRGSPGAP